MNGNKRKIFCLMGPTGSGKTELAIRLVNQFPFEIISVDSAMIYRGMNIGTAKPTLEQLQLAPHHLIDICDPKDSYSAGQFREDALQRIEQIFIRGRVPLLVGGTMLYFRVLQQGISNLPKANEEVRSEIRAWRDQVGLEVLYGELQRIDPKSSRNIKPTDSQRIQRALEVYKISGKSLSELTIVSPPIALPYEVINLVVAPKEISLLRGKIKIRFHKMIESGFIEEVKKLYRRQDLHADLPSIRSVGYRQVWQYLSNEISYDEMLELIPITTGQLAKRQLTWLKNWQDIKRFDSEDSKLLPNIMNSIDI